MSDMNENTKNFGRLMTVCLAISIITAGMIIAVDSYSHDEKNTIEYNSAVANIEKGEIQRSSTSIDEDDQLKDVEINENESPFIEITSPEDDSLFRTNSMTTTWYGYDNQTEIKYYEVRLNETDWLNVGTANAHTFSELEDGEYTVEVRAWNEEDNTSTDEITFLIDTTGPIIEINNPLDGVEELTYDGDFVIEGTTEPDAIVRIREEEVEIDENGDFIYETTLLEGQNVFYIEAEDEAGNTASTSVYVLYLPQIAELREDVDGITMEISEIETGIEEINDDITDIQSELISLEDSISSVETEVAVLEQELSSLESSVELLEDRVSDLEDIDFDALESRVDDLEEQLEELEELEERVSDLEEIDYDELKGRIEEQEEDIQDLIEQTTELYNNIDETNVKIQDLEEYIVEIEERLDDIENNDEGNDDEEGGDDGEDPEKEYLFSLARVEYEEYLDEGSIHSELEKAFDDRGHAVSEDANLSEENGVWHISESGDTEYLIEIDDDELLISEESNTEDNSETPGFTLSILVFATFMTVVVYKNKKSKT